jgi:hypothetical protein
LGEQTFTRFAISPNGFIYLGGDDPFAVDATEVSSGINSGRGYGTKQPVLSDDDRFETGATNVLGFSRIGALVNDEGANYISATTADASTEISYLLSGNSGSKVLTVQFKKIILSLDATYLDAVDIQIRLYEADSRVELIFNDFASATEHVWAEIGLKGNQHRNTKYLAIDAGSNWSTATAGVTGNVGLRNSVCDDGATFTFTPPPACAAPAAKPTDLELTPASNSISGSFTASDADKYLVLVALKENVSTTVGTDDKPSDNTSYNVGDSINGKWRVIAFSPDANFSADGLNGSTEYYFTVYPANTECLNGPKYLKIGNPLSRTIKTLPAAPQLSLSEGGFMGLKLAAQANADNNPIIVAVNARQWAVDGNNNQLNDGAFGTPAIDANVGDLLDGGGTVIYKGPASGAIEVTGLTPNKLVNFAAWSYDETQGVLSTEVKKFNVTPWGELPYSLDGKQYAPYDIPVSWERESSNPDEDSQFQLTRNDTDRRGYQLRILFSGASPETPVYNSIATQYLKLPSGNSYLVLSGLLQYNVTGLAGYTEWHEKDSLVFLAKRASGDDYVPFYTINSTNAGNFFKESASGSFSNINIPIEGFANDTVKVKIAWTTHQNGTFTLLFTKFLIEERNEYAAPINLAADAASIIGSQAKITWDKHADGTETVWEVRRRFVNTNWSDPLEADWSAPVQTSETNYLFTDLPFLTNVEVEVRAVVGPNTYSPWTVPVAFKTAYGLPYSENFNSYTSTTFTAANSGWTLPSLTAVVFRVDDTTLSLRFVMRQTPVPPTKYITALLPKLDFGDGSANYKLAFDLSATANMPATDSIYVIDKTNGEEIILKEYPYTVSGSDTIVLEGFSGIKQIGFKSVEAARLNAAFFDLDNVSIFPTCPVAVSKAKASEIRPEKAKVSWEGEADEWLVFIRKAGETAKDFVIRTANDTLFTNLEEATAYEVGVTTSCAPGDTARVTIVRFTTPTSIPCNQVSNIVPTPYTESITLAWESEAAKFNVRVRPAGTETWPIQRTVTENTVTITGLTHNTEYEYSIQTVCSENEGDVSEYTEPATVKTVEITCFAPTNILADPLGYKSATLSWEGEASRYELLWRSYSVGEGGWTTVIVEGKSYSLSNLTSQMTYQAKVRAICAEGDTSVYTPVYQFVTTAIPACPIPTALTVSSVGAYSALLGWTADEANTSWDLRYRFGVAAWTNILALTATSFELTNLTENTVYFWSVKANCAETENESAYATQEEFTTTGTGIGSISSDLKVSVSSRIVSVVNPGGAYIRNIQLYAIDGSLLQDFEIRSSDNVLIPTSLTQKAAIVKVIGNDAQATFKTVVK